VGSMRQSRISLFEVTRTCAGIARALCSFAVLVGIVVSLGFAPSALAAETGQIAGKVTNAASKEALEGIEVCAYAKSVGGSVCAKTGPSGEYTVAELKAGEYKVEFSAWERNYLPQYYDAKPSSSEAQLVSVVAAQTTPGIDAALQEGAQITGKVTDASTREAINGLEVCVVAVSNGEARCGTTAGGEYDIIRVPTGGYRVEFGVEYTHKFNYIPQFYDDKGSSAESQTVSAVAGAVTSGIDAQLQEGGRIAGAVSVPGGGLTPHIVDVNVCAYTVGGEFSGCGNPKLNGEYAIEGLESGEYKVGFSSFVLGYLPQYYDDKSSLAEAVAVSVTVGHTTPEVNAKLESAGKITGRVTDAATKAPIQDIQVCVQPSTWINCVWTDSNGEYTISELASGEYKVEFLPYGRDYFFLRRSVSVTAGQVTSGVDAALTEGGRMTGRVTDASTGEPIEDVLACADGVGGADGECGITNANGEYTILALNGQYRVQFSALSGSYLSEFYGDKYSLAESEASLISVAAPGTVSGIDVAMRPGRFTGPANTAPPVVSGVPVVGGALSCSSGSWTGNPAPTLTYKWLRDGTQIPGAGQSSYIAQSADEGHSLSCEVIAMNAAGNTIGTEHAMSAGVIVAAGSSSGAPSDGSISPSLSTVSSAGLMNSTPTVTIPLVTLMTSRLVVSGSSAPVHVECRAAPCRGSIELTMQMLIKHGKGKTAAPGRAAPLLLATGAFSLAKGKSRTVVLHLTAVGKKMLAHVDRHHPIAVTLTLSVRSGQTTTKSVLIR
jgi:Carboxypeptidase regulatory-like domain